MRILVSKFSTNMGNYQTSTFIFRIDCSTNFFKIIWFKCLLGFLKESGMWISEQQLQGFEVLKAVCEQVLEHNVLIEACIHACVDNLNDVIF